MIQFLRGNTTAVDETTRTITARWYSGATVERFDWWTGEEWRLKFDMSKSAVSLDRFNGGAPLLRDHMPFLDDQVGRVEKAWIEDGAGLATVRFSDREDVTPLWNDIKSGIVTSVSMGASVRQTRDITQKGDKIKTLLAIDWEPMELSIVAVPADSKAQFMLANEDPEMIREFLRWRKEIRAAAESPKPAQPDDSIRRNLEREKLRYAYLIA